MKKIIFVCIFIFYQLIGVSLFATESKSVLIINSYHKGFEWSDKIIKGMEEVFYQTNIDTNILYMDSKRIISQEYFNKLRELYKLQLRRHSYDLIIAIDKFAYNFILENYYDLCDSQSIYFVGIEQFFKEEVRKYKLEDKVSGMLEKRAISETIKMIPKLIPNLKKLYIINDKSKNGDDTEPFINEAMKNVASKFSIEYIRSITFDGLKNKLSKFKKNEAVFFIRFYNDSTGKLYKNHEIASLIDSSQLPVFVTDTLFIGKGALGGKLVNINKLGINSGKRVIDILNKDIKSPIIETDDSYDYIFDYHKVKYFKLNPSFLSKDFSYINAPISFFDKNREFIDFVFVLSPFLIFLILGLIHNLYLRMKSTKQLKQRMQFDKVLLNSIKSPIVWQDKDGYIVDSNTRFCDLMDMSCEQTRGKKLKDYVQNKNVNSLLVALKNFVKNSSLEQNEVVLKSKDNKEYIYMMSQTDYIEDIYKTKGTVTVFTDITKEKQALKEKTVHQEFLIQQSKLAEIGEIFSSIAHQWKTPLVEIATIAQEQIYSKEDEITQKDSEYVNDIMVQVRYMTETINDFQEFIKPSNKKTSFDIYEAVIKMMEIIRHNMKYNYIDVKIKVDSNAKLNVIGYKNELMQTLLNIVNNAKEAILKSKNKKKGQINISIESAKKYLLLHIEDNGGGIPKNEIKNIFDSYYTTKENGHGIGLYMAKLIIENKMRGSISVRNTMNGAKFSIKLRLFDENISS